MNFQSQMQLEVPVVDRDAMEQFYTELLGLELVTKNGRESIVQLFGGELKLIKVNKQIRGKNLRNLRLTLHAADVEQLKERLIEAGLSVTGPKEVEGGFRAIGFKDPEGLLVRCLDAQGAPATVADMPSQPQQAPVAPAAPATPPPTPPPAPARKKPALKPLVTPAGAARPSKMVAPPTAVPVAPTVAVAAATSERTGPPAAPSDPTPGQAQVDELAQKLIQFLRGIERDVRAIQDIMQGFAEGRLTMAKVNSDYSRLFARIDPAIGKLKKLGLRYDHRNPYENLLQFFLFWTRNLPTSAQRREYIANIYADILKTVDFLATKLAQGIPPTALFPNIR